MACTSADCWFVSRSRWRRGTWPVSSGRLALLFAQSIDGAHCLDGQSVECERRLTNLGLEDACGLGQQDLAGLEIGKLLDSLGAQLSAEAVKKLADLESREVLLAKAAGVLKAKIGQAAFAFNALPVKAVRTIDALREKQSEAA